VGGGTGTDSVRQIRQEEVTSIYLTADYEKLMGLEKLQIIFESRPPS
jgi:hypothetical protein